MKKSGRAIQTLVVALVTACGLPQASASVTYSVDVNTSDMEPFNTTIDGDTTPGALTGGIHLTLVSSTDPSLPGNYVTVCSDIEGALNIGQSYEYNTPVTPFSGQSGLNPMWGDLSSDGSAAKAIQNAAYLFYNFNNLTGGSGNLTSDGLTGTAQEMATLQLAVWMALYNTVANGSVTGTRFSVTGADTTAIADAASWVLGLNGSYDYTGYLLYPTDGSAPGAPQELLIAAPVPEAPTVIAGALLLLPLGASAFRVLRRRHA